MRLLLNSNYGLDGALRMSSLNWRSIEEELRACFVSNVAIRALPPCIGEEFLFPEELQIVSRATKKRRCEFAAGRVSARLALIELGEKPCRILCGSDRLPKWPSGFVGSIAHCDTVCLAAVVRKSNVVSIGIDVEELSPLSQDLAKIVCRQDESEHFSILPRPTAGNWPKIYFSIKEACYKCYYQRSRTFLEFSDLSVRVFPNKCLSRGEFKVSMCSTQKLYSETLSQFSGFWLIYGDNIYAGCIFAH